PAAVRAEQLAAHGVAAAVVAERVVGVVRDQPGAIVVVRRRLRADALARLVLDPGDRLRRVLRLEPLLEGLGLELGRAPERAGGEPRDPRRGELDLELAARLDRDLAGAAEHLGADAGGGADPRIEVRGGRRPRREVGQPDAALELDRGVVRIVLRL